MVKPRVLSTPPIIEALVDLRASVPGDREAFTRLSEKFRADFPSFTKAEFRQQVKGQVKYEEGKFQSHIESPIFSGVRLESEDQSIFVHLQPDGFSLNNVKGYIGGDELISKALKYWSWVVDHATPESVSRVALNYINRLDLPLKQGDNLNEYLNSPPSLPEGSPQNVVEYVSHIVAYDPTRSATATVTQQLKQQDNPEQPIVIKVALEACRQGSFSFNETALRNALHSLRILKNETFFSLLTEKTVRLYQ